MMQNNLNTMVSVYIPHVFSSISKECVLRVFQDKFNLGIVSKIECIPKVNLKDGHEYYSCFVFFEKWNDNSNSKFILNTFKMGTQAKMFYSDNKYWMLGMNKSEVAYYKDPIHTDIVIYDIPLSFPIDYLPSIMESLDLGKIHSYSIKEENMDGKVICNVSIYFEFWYRTKTSYAFQDIVRGNNLIEIKVSDENTLTFYYQSPRFAGINPNVWKLSK